MHGVLKQAWGSFLEGWMFENLWLSVFARLRTVFTSSLKPVEPPLLQLHYNSFPSSCYLKSYFLLRQGFIASSSGVPNHIVGMVWL